MKFRLRRKQVELRSATSEVLTWIECCFEREEIWKNFGMTSPEPKKAESALANGGVVATIHTAARAEPIGFIIVFAPTRHFLLWEFSFAIVDKFERNAFSAMAAADAMCHYLFDHKGIDGLAWRIRKDNRASAAVVRRMGYERFREWTVQGIDFDLYWMDLELWQKRQARLRRMSPGDVPLFEVKPSVC